MTTSQRLIVKVGSALLCADDGTVRADFVQSVVDDVVRLMENGKQVLIVTSGAVAIGRRTLGLKGKLTLEEKQAASAVGQTALIDAWRNGFAKHKKLVAQVLLTLDDTEIRKRYLNARATMNTLLSVGAIPIINENDTIATSEIRYGDNDRLAAHTAQISSADLLVILCDVDGLYTADPSKDKSAEFIACVDDLSREVMSYAGGENSQAQMGSGGMRSKLQAAEIAARSGCSTIIASGRVEHPLRAIATGANATLIRASLSTERARRQWIGSRLQRKGGVVVDDGAVIALREGASLLAVGIAEVFGVFTRGDVILVRGPDGRDFGQGISAFDVSEVEKIAGKPSSAIELELGIMRRPAIIEKDDLFLF